MWSRSILLEDVMVNVTNCYCDFTFDYIVDRDMGEPHILSYTICFNVLFSQLLSVPMFYKKSCE